KELTIGTELSKKLENYDVQAYGYDLLYTLYSEIGNSDKAMFYAKLSFEFSEKSDNVKIVFSAREDLINLFIKNKSWNEALKQLKVNLEALNQLKFSEVQNSIYTKSIHLKLALCYHYLNKKNLSLHHLDLSEKVNIQFKELIAAEYINLVTLISKAYEELGLYKKSIEYYRLESELLDSINNEENRRIISELETKYQTEKKEQEIANLQQAAEIQSLKLNSYLIGGGSLLLILIGGGILYYRQYKTKRDKASVELEQRFLRSQLNPHFIFNSMGAIQNYLLTENSEKASIYMSMFSKLMRQILENSREEFIPLSEEIEMLTNYMELQKLRFKDLTYTIEVDDTLDEDTAGLPPMFAQPFIENALEHGLFKKEDKNEAIFGF
ncbi:MAG: histidine kinase, partial [Bacteroidota bacterium]